MYWPSIISYVTKRNNASFFLSILIPYILFNANKNVVSLTFFLKTTSYLWLVSTLLNNHWLVVYNNEGLTFSIKIWNIKVLPKTYSASISSWEGCEHLWSVLFSLFFLNYSVKGLWDEISSFINGMIWISRFSSIVVPFVILLPRFFHALEESPLSEKPTSF